MKLTLNSLVALTIADIDIFLLKTEDQKEDNNKEVFTREEIREQLMKTARKVQNVLQKFDFSINEPLLTRKETEVYYSLEDENLSSDRRYLSISDTSTKAKEEIEIEKTGDFLNELEAQMFEDGSSHGVCRVCGCTDLDCTQCIEKDGVPCWWVEDDLCSSCETTQDGANGNLAEVEIDS